MLTFCEEVIVVVNGKPIDAIVKGPVPYTMLLDHLNQPPDINSTIGAPQIPYLDHPGNQMTYDVRQDKVH